MKLIRFLTANFCYSKVKNSTVESLIEEDDLHELARRVMEALRPGVKLSLDEFLLEHSLRLNKKEKALCACVLMLFNKL